MRYTAIIEGGRFEIEVTRGNAGTIEAQIGGTIYTLQTQSVEPGIFWFQWNNRSIEISVIPSGEAYKVSVDGRSFDVELLDARAALRKVAQHGHAATVELRAPMPGKVVRVLVTEGMSVEMNQGLLVIEA